MRQAFVIFTRRTIVYRGKKRDHEPGRSRRQDLYILHGDVKPRNIFLVPAGSGMGSQSCRLSNATMHMRRCSVWRLNIGSSLGWLFSWVTSALHVSARERQLVPSCILKPVAANEMVGTLPLPLRWSRASAHSALLRQRQDLKLVRSRITRLSWLHGTRDPV